MPARGRLRVPAISETGYHRLIIDGREIVLAIAPAQCRTIEDVVPDARLWGPAAQVYGLRTPGDGGIGDMAGVAQLAASAARHGADVLGLSPLHALFTADPGRFGPYAPSSRLFLNPLHAAPALVFGEERLRHAIADAGQQTAYQRLESLNLIDWPAAAKAKLRVLRALFDGFVAGDSADTALAGDFARFRAEGGALLEEHARFEALHADQMPEHDWRRWPVDLRHPAGAAVEAFAGAHRREVLFHAFLQWVADRSLAAAQARARDAGMRIGLIVDLAVGMDPTGSHAWGRQNDILLGLSIGAPPDLFNPRGQDWGLTGFSPARAGGWRLRPVHRHPARGDAARRRGAHRPRHGTGPVVAGAGRRRPGGWRLPGLSVRRPAAAARAGIGAQRRRGDRGRPGHRAGRVPRNAAAKRRPRHARAVVRARREERVRRPAHLGGIGAGDDLHPRPADRRGLVARHRYRRPRGARPTRRTG